MHIVRAAGSDDLAQLIALGEQSGAGPGRAHRMPVGAVDIGNAIAQSLASFAAPVDAPGGQRYLLVLERTADGTIEGCAAIAALAGDQSTYFTFRRDVLRQVSVELAMAHEMRALTMASDLSRHSHLCSMFVLPGAGVAPAALLARARLLLAAAAPERFGQRFFASLPGVACTLRQPFWDAIGSQFFDIPLGQLETLLGDTRNHPAMVEMMPHYPIYVDLLDPQAQAVIGQADADAGQFGKALAAEGFEGGKYAGLLDGGAILHAQRSQLRSFAAGARGRATVSEHGGAHSTHLVATARCNDFRAVACAVIRGQSSANVGLFGATMRALALASGDEVVCVEH